MSDDTTRSRPDGSPERAAAGDGGDVPWHQSVTAQAADKSSTRAIVGLLIAALAVAVVVGLLAITGYMSKRNSTEAPKGPQPLQLAPTGGTPGNAGERSASPGGEPGASAQQ